MYWAGALLVLSHVRSSDVLDRRPWLGVVGVYTLLGLEEIDYFGIFGGLIGRIEGVYAGSLHDLVRLFTEGVLAWLTWALIGLALTAAHLFGWVARPPTPEEAVELAGAVCVGVYALELSKRCGADEPL